MSEEKLIIKPKISETKKLQKLNNSEINIIKKSKTVDKKKVKKNIEDTKE